jgi:hypothetical protein
MNQHSDMDALMRKKLYDTEVAPPAFVWPNVEAALQKRKRRAFLWIFSGIGVAVLGAGLLLRFYAGSGINVPTAQTQSVQQAPSAQTTTPNADQHIAETSPEITVSTSNTASKSISEPALPGIERNVSAHKNGNIAGQTNRNKTTRSPFNPNKAAVIEQVVTPIAPITYGAVVTDLGLDAFAPTLASNTVTHPASLLFLPQLATDLSQAIAVGDPSGLKRPVIRKKKEPKNCYNFTKHPNAWFFDVYAGPSFAWKDLSTNNPEYKDYRNRRLNSERRDWAFHSGVRGTLLFDGHFMLRLGLHYDQMTEIFEFIDPNSITINYKDVITYVNGQPVIVRDTIGISYGSNYTKTYNRFGMLQIPLQAGVELRKGRSGFSFNAGVSFNVWFWKRGAILSAQGMPRYFTPGADLSTPAFQKRTSLSAIGSVQWFYHVDPSVRVYIEPYFRQIVQPVNLKSHPVGTRYGIGGISLGLTKIF